MSRLMNIKFKIADEIIRISTMTKGRKESNLQRGEFQSQRQNKSIKYQESLVQFKTYIFFMFLFWVY